MRSCFHCPSFTFRDNFTLPSSRSLVIKPDLFIYEHLYGDPTPCQWLSSPNKQDEGLYLRFPRPVGKAVPQGFVKECHSGSQSYLRREDVPQGWSYHREGPSSLSCYMHLLRMRRIIFAGCKRSHIWKLVISCRFSTTQISTSRASINRKAVCKSNKMNLRSCSFPIPSLQNGVHGTIYFQPHQNFVR